MCSDLVLDQRARMDGNLATPLLSKCLSGVKVRREINPVGPSSASSVMIDLPL